tara:strand:- start:3711 stop:4526 length:816 start_codon:yes stop_codon:yes gene_type:complete
MLKKLIFFVTFILLLSCSNDINHNNNKKVIIIQGICSKYPQDSEHWGVKIKKLINENYKFIDKKTGDIDDQIIDFSYSSTDWTKNYYPEETLLSIQNPISNLEKIYEKYPNSEFYILGHSLGGVIALSGIANSEKINKQTKSVVTISSPIKGVNKSDENSGLRSLIELFACNSKENHENKIWDDISNDSKFIKQISAHDYNNTKVYNIVNKYDLVVSSESAKLEKNFPYFCINEVDKELFGLNHSTLLDNKVISTEIINLLIDDKKIVDDC